jgi:putative PIN family toxin of toxin-antitoxin system
VKVVIDSNIYISAFLFDRVPEEVVDLGIAGRFKVYSSIYIIGEVRRVLCEKLGTSDRFAILAAKRIERISTVIPVRGNIRGPVPSDPKDGPIIKTCLACRADFLVTGDRRLAALEVRGMRTLGPSRFLRHVATAGLIT